VADNGVAGRDPLTAQPPQWAAAQAPATPAQPAASAPYGGPYASGTPYGGYPAAAAAGGRSPRRIVGGLIAAAGGGAVIGGSFLDWFGAGGFSLTGWDIYDLRSAMNENVFVVGKFFDNSMPLFTGLTTLIVGCVLVAVALLVMALPGGKPGAPEINGGVKAIAWIALLAVAIPALVNLVGWLAKGQDQGADAAAGFWLVVAGAVAGIVGVAIGTGGKRPAQW